MSLPPRALNAFRLGSVALRLADCFSSASLTPVSKLKLRKSQAESLKTMLVKKFVPKPYCRLLPGAEPVIQADQPPGPASPPGEKPGEICSPLEFFGPA